MDPSDLGAGGCTRYPPYAFPLVRPNGEQQVLTIWPQTRNTQGCGEFQSSLTTPLRAV